MIILNLKGGIGNQIFQLGAAIRFAKGKIDFIKLKKDLLNENQKNLLEKIFLSNNLPENYDNNQIKDKPIYMIGDSDDGPFCDQKNLDYDINLVENDVVLDGYFQSYSNLFHLKKWIVANQIKIISKSNSFSDRTLVMHYRQGDYLRKDVQKELGLINLSYIDRAISIFKEKIDKIIIHSDDLNLLNRYENLDNLEIKISKNEMDSFCDFLGAKNLVIPNSTFSLTAALLSNDLNLLIRPSRWSRKYFTDDLTNNFDKKIIYLSNSFY
jgi:hypothetical protein